MAASSETAQGSAEGATHRVENQPPPLPPCNLFEMDPALVEALEREGGGWGADRAAPAAFPQAVRRWQRTST